MKKLLMIFILYNLFLTSCSNNSHFNENLKICEDLVLYINSFFCDTASSDYILSNYYTDDFIFHYFPAGNRKGIKVSKEEFLNFAIEMKKNNANLNIAHTIFLPGINESTHRTDGSVRVYYGADIFYKKDTIQYSGYQTINFKNQKISAIWEWADYGGISKLLNAKSK
tara:strand:- start:938 stop:1441 length:504 start_codon:yes stop_codon:yes gene_type:complete